MKFLIDNALSPALAALLQQAGHDAVHVRSIGLQHADDDAIFDRAAAPNRRAVTIHVEANNRSLATQPAPRLPPRPLDRRVYYLMRWTADSPEGFTSPRTRRLVHLLDMALDGSVSDDMAMLHGRERVVVAWPPILERVRKEHLMVGVPGDPERDVRSGAWAVDGREIVTRPDC
jgi:hypothetical protein